MSDSHATVYAALKSWTARNQTAGSGNYADDFLRYVRAKIPFYRDLDPSAARCPLTSRADYRRDITLFQPTPPPALAYTLTSSGTTGEPLRVLLDEPTWYAVNHHYFTQVSELAGLPPGTFEPGRPAVLFVTNKPGRRPAVIPLPALNNGIYLRMPLTARPGAMLAAFRRFRVPALYGKPSYLLDLREALIRDGAMQPPWQPLLLLVSGESLFPDHERRLSAYFGAPVIDALSSTEGGLIAARLPGSGYYQVFADNVRLEIRTEAGDTRASGTGEIILTNLLNRATVFVRYRTGDTATLLTDASAIQRLAGLAGREPAALPLPGGPLPTGELDARLSVLPGLGDYQVEATPGGLAVLRWAPDVLCEDESELANALRRELADVLPDGTVRLERQDRITPPGGKKRRYLTAAGPAR